jgi:hypothetical protein
MMIHQSARASLNQQRAANERVSDAIASAAMEQRAKMDGRCGTSGEEPRMKEIET